MPVPIGSLATEMGLLTLRCLLITTVCRTPLLSASFRAAGLTTVALPAVAVAAYIKEDTTTRPTTKTRTESRFRHPCPGPFDSVFHQIKIHRFSDDRKMMAPAARMMSLATAPAEVQKTTISDDR